MLLFELPGPVYGVNAAKVREVILPQSPTPLPESHAVVEGVLNLRGTVVPIISLRKYFGLGEPENPDQQRVIVMEFSDVSVGFLVDDVDKIYRISWADLSPIPEEAIMQGAAFTAIAQIEERIVLVVDFECIMVEVSGSGFDGEPHTQAGRSNREDRHVVIAEDSHTIHKLIQGHLEGAGYSVKAVCDGQAAWEALQERLSSGEPQFDLLVSDIEMPWMGGLHLTRMVKESKELSHIPVILFSSLITPDNLKKGKSVGADLQISKPAVHQNCQFADQVLAKGVQAVQQIGTTI